MTLNGLFGLCLRTFSYDGTGRPYLGTEICGSVDFIYEYAEDHNIDGDDFRIMINNAICDLLGIDEPDLI
jgi:hypothetical protein